MAREAAEIPLFAVAALIGALLVSRVITDPRRSDAVPMAVRQRLPALGGADPADTASGA
jgi:hypothetical protein